MRKKVITIGNGIVIFIVAVHIRKHGAVMLTGIKEARGVVNDMACINGVLLLFIRRHSFFCSKFHGCHYGRRHFRNSGNHILAGIGSQVVGLIHGFLAYRRGEIWYILVRVVRYSSIGLSFSAGS
jgi:hypothetical protein